MGIHIFRNKVGTISIALHLIEIDNGFNDFSLSKIEGKFFFFFEIVGLIKPPFQESQGGRGNSSGTLIVVLSPGVYFFSDLIDKEGFAGPTNIFYSKPTLAIFLKILSRG